MYSLHIEHNALFFDNIQLVVVVDVEHSLLW